MGIEVDPVAIILSGNAEVAKTPASAPGAEKLERCPLNSVRLPSIGANSLFFVSKMLENGAQKPASGIFGREDWKSLRDLAGLLCAQEKDAKTTRMAGMRYFLPLSTEVKAGLFADMLGGLTQKVKASGQDGIWKDEASLAYVSTVEAVLGAMLKELKSSGGLDGSAQGVQEALVEAQKMGLMAGARLEDAGNFSTC
ncbi:MAG: hypothetical protein V1728_04265 [Candidatus Micrarchaeota archaeon]